MENYIIRKIEKLDNQQVAQLIRFVFDELEFQTGTAYEEDPLFRSYVWKRDTINQDLFMLWKSNVKLSGL
jgi:putative acetyltransferase